VAAQHREGAVRVVPALPIDQICSLCSSPGHRLVCRERSAQRDPLVTRQSVSDILYELSREEVRHPCRCWFPRLLGLTD
jgi:hypothetical protein